MNEVAKIASIADGVAICISDDVLVEMSRDDADLLLLAIQKTIADAGMAWVIERDVALMETRITPVRHAQV